VNRPHTAEGWAAWDVGLAALRAGWDGAELDLAGALAAALADGIPRAPAPSYGTLSASYVEQYVWEVLAFGLLP
jgi:hypothetical protein